MREAKLPYKLVKDALFSFFPPADDINSSYNDNNVLVDDNNSTVKLTIPVIDPNNTHSATIQHPQLMNNKHRQRNDIPHSNKHIDNNSNSHSSNYNNHYNNIYYNNSSNNNINNHYTGPMTRSMVQ